MSLSPDHIPRAAIEVVERLTQGGHQAFFVGGSVRDLLRGERPKDFDVATSAHPEQVQKLFRKVIPTGIEHGTVTVLSGGLAIEVTTFRSEGKYEDGRRPAHVQFESDIEMDLSRRDFTINAMAFDPVAGALRDPFGGQADLQRKIVRTVGAAVDRFSEDGLRPMRAVRFATVLGFELEEETARAIPATLGVFTKVAVERIREELTKILLSPRVAWGVERLADSGLLGAFLPGLKAAEPGQSPPWLRLLSAVEPEPSLRLAALLLPLAQDRPSADPELGFPLAETAKLLIPALESLKLSRQLASEIERLLQLQTAWKLPAVSDPQLRRLAARAGLPLLPRLRQFWEAIGKTREIPMAPPEWWLRVDQIVACPPPLAIDRLALDGGAVMRLLGVGPSPAVGEALRFLLDAVLEDPGLNSATELEHRLKAWALARGL